MTVLGQQQAVAGYSIKNCFPKTDMEKKNKTNA